MDLFKKYNYLRNKLSSYSCFIVAGELEKIYSRDELLKSMEILISRRKSLRSNVVNGEIIEVDYDINSAIEFIDTDQEIVDLIDELHDTKFKTESSTDLLWKLVINKSWWIVLCDHTFLDGNSAAFIIEDLISILENEEIPEDKELNIELLCKPSIWFVFKTLFNEYVYGVAVNSYSELNKDISTFHTLKKLIKIDKERFNKLNQITKKEKISITALLLYYNLKSLEKDLKVSVPVNLRKFLNSEYSRSYGLGVSAVNMTLNYNKSNWDYLKWIQSQLIESNQKNSAQLVGMLNYTNIEEYLTKKIKSSREPTLEISNLGKRNSRNINQFLFSQPNNHSGALITNNVISSDKFFNILICASPEFKPYFDKYVHNLENLLQ